MTSRKPTKEDEDRGRKLARRRRAHRVSQAQLAAHLKVTAQQIGKYERGENRIPMNRYDRAMAFLGEPDDPSAGFAEGVAPYDGERRPNLDEAASLMEQIIRAAERAITILRKR